MLECECCCCEQPISTQKFFLLQFHWMLTTTTFAFQHKIQLLLMSERANFETGILSDPVPDRLIHPRPQVSEHVSCEVIKCEILNRSNLLEGPCLSPWTVKLVRHLSIGSKFGTIKRQHRNGGTTRREGCPGHSRTPKSRHATGGFRRASGSERWNVILTLHLFTRLLRPHPGKVK